MGGSIAAHQCEGAVNEGNKGTGIMDLVTVGAYGQPREIHETFQKTAVTPLIKELTSIIVIRKTSLYLLKWDLRLCEFRLIGREFFQKGMRKFRIRRGWISIMMSLMNFSNIISNQS